ncbi:NUDIX hydrolase [Kordiimonas aquimaris]|uniref:NUDIX hydrolase n=1 Tax=Kordiimonas aquimaris TaxID=707591 RepID=UPI0021D0E8BC|nr:NUDIX hydrolase [Kordiimonas aquimaris]
MQNNRENPSRPIVGVGAVVMKENKVLLIKRGKSPRKGEWSLPGGAIELGETVTAAMSREIREETGLSVTFSEIIDIIDFIEHTPDEKTKFHYVLIDYLAYYKEGTLKAGSDADDARFFNIDDAVEAVSWGETKRIIRKAWDMAQTK